jgi:ATP adenylyltransferase
LDLFQTITRMIDLLEKVLNPEGFNVGLNLGRVAGAGLPGHLHWHIVPRWSGDTNFMPVLAGIRVIPQSLEALWQALGEALKD